MSVPHLLCVRHTLFTFCGDAAVDYTRYCMTAQLCIKHVKHDILSVLFAAIFTASRVWNKIPNCLWYINMSCMSNMNVSTSMLSTKELTLWIIVTNFVYIQLVYPMKYAHCLTFAYISGPLDLFQDIRTFPPIEHSLEIWTNISNKYTTNLSTIKKKQRTGNHMDVS